MSDDFVRTLEQVVNDIGFKAEGKVDVNETLTPFRTFNENFGGFQHGTLTIFAVTTGKGASFPFLANIALKTAQRGKKVLLVSTEKNQYEMAQFLLSMVSLVDLKKIYSGKMSQEEGDRIMEGARRLDELKENLFFSESPLPKPNEKLLIQDIFIDGAHLLYEDELIPLKDSAKNSNASIVVTTRTDAGNRVDKRPRLEDLSHIDISAASRIFGLYQNPCDEDRKDIAEIGVLKHPTIFGMTRPIKLAFHATCFDYQDFPPS